MQEEKAKEELEKAARAVLAEKERKKVRQRRGFPDRMRFRTGTFSCKQ